MAKKHDIHDFLISAQENIKKEYERILRRATEDPGTAGDQGEENWATLLRNWLPSYFQIVTKGRILCENGFASPQIDVLVLYPSYPKVLLDKKLYLAAGVAAAFECKTSITSAHVNKAVETAVQIRKNLPNQIGSPYKELNSKIIYGLLAHSHTWKKPTSKPLNNIEKALMTADLSYVQHPIQQLDFVTVSDLATWQARKITFIGPSQGFYNKDFAKLYGENGSATSSYMCASIGSDEQEEYFSPISVLLSGLFSKLAWLFIDMRELEGYFRKVNMLGCGQGTMRTWPITIYTQKIRKRVIAGQLSNGAPFDEWSLAF